MSTTPNTVIGPNIITPPSIESEINRISKDIFHFDSLRPGQLEISVQVLKNKKDSIFVAPSLYGKSSIYKLCACSTEYGKGCIVISPFINIIHQQFQEYNKATSEYNKNRKPAIPLRHAIFISESDDTLFTNDLFQKYSLLFLSPEKLLNKIEKINLLDVVAIFFEECHLLQVDSDYDAKCQRLLSHLKRGNDSKTIPVVALSHCYHKKIDISLKLNTNRILLRKNNDSPTFNIHVHRKIDSPSTFQEIIRMLQSFSTDTTKKNVLQKTIVYTKTKKDVNEIYDWILSQLHQNVKHVVKKIHSDLTNVDRMMIQSSFIRGISQVLITTFQYGFGVNIPDLVSTVHYGSPPDVTTFYSNISRGLNPVLSSVFTNENDFIRQGLVLSRSNKMSLVVNDRVQCKNSFLAQYLRSQDLQESHTLFNPCTFCDSCLNHSTDGDNVSIIDIDNTGGRFLLYVLDNVLNGTKTTIQNTLNGTYSAITFRDDSNRLDIIQTMNKLKLEIEQYIDITEEYIFHGIIPGLEKSKYISFDYTAGHYYGKDKKTKYLKYTLTDKGTLVLRNEQLIFVESNSYIDAGINLRKARNLERLQYLLDSGLDLEILSPTEKATGEGDLVENMYFFGLFLNRSTNQDEVDSYGELYEILTLWRENEAQEIYGIPLHQEVIMNLSVLYKMIPIIAVMDNPITMLDLIEQGLENGDVGSLCTKINDWQQTLWDIKSRSMSAVNERNNDPVTNQNSNPHIETHENLIPIFAHVPKKSKFQQKQSYWNDSLTRFQAGDTVSQIASETWNKKESRYGIKENTVLTHLFTAYYSGQNLDLEKLSREKQQPTVHQWMLMESCYGYHQLSVVETNVSWPKYLAPIIPSLNDDWIRCMNWFVGLKRAGYPYPIESDNN